MAKIDLKFLDFTDEDLFIKCEIKNDLYSGNQFIEIKSNDYNHNICIWLDKSTAIKFAKTLRTEINKMKEANNG